MRIANTTFIAPILAIVLMVSLTSCGFQSTKPLSAHTDWTPIYFKPRNSLGYELRRSLQANDAFTSRRSEAKSELLISQQSLDQRDLSVTSDGRNAEFLLILTADLVWKKTTPEDGGDGALKNQQSSYSNLLLLEDSFSTETSFLANPLNPSAQSAERSLTVSRLEKRLVNNMIRQMSLTATINDNKISASVE